jgi:hypothetical protein
MSDSTSWAEAEFGHAELGDPRRTARLVKVAAEVARRPAGTVLQACATSASREGAFRLLENDAVHPGDVRDAMVQATTRKCAKEKRVFVAIDGTSLGLTDNARSKGLGGVGAWKLGGRGVQVMTALAVEQDGSALGICGQRMWSREARSRHGRHGAKGATSENTVWLELLRETHREFAEAAPACLPWFQMDRGADCWQVLELSAKLDVLMTVRATHDRRTDQGASRLWSTLQRGPVLAKRKVQVSARAPGWRKKRVKGKRIKVKTPARRPRLATVAIRATTVAIECTTETGRKFTVSINAVLVSEVNRSSKDKLEWMLLTTHPVRTRLNALEVVRGYTLRWRIEEFHRLWKTGLCCVEDTQLRSRDAIFKWATILAAVATRAMRITHLARSTPDVPASTEFTPTELRALIALRQPNDVEDDHVPTLAVAVRWIADLGGYTGPWNGLPGAIVIGRGLYDLSIATRAFENRRKKR